MSNPATLEVQAVLRFITCFNENRIDDAMAMLHDQVFYHNIPMEPMTGRHAVNAFTRGFGIGTRFKTEWTMITIAGHGNIVLTERVDAFMTEDGGRFDIPVMGSFKVSGGLITEWRDYFDLGDFQSKLGALDLNQAPAANGRDDKSSDTITEHQKPWPYWETH